MIKKIKQLRIWISTVSVAVVAAMCACIALNGCEKPESRGTEGSRTSAHGYMLASSQHSPYDDGVFIGRFGTKEPLQYKILIIEKGDVEVLSSGTVSPKDESWGEHQFAARIVAYGDKHALLISILNGETRTIPLVDYDHFSLSLTAYYLGDYSLSGDQIMYALFAAREGDPEIPLKANGMSKIKSFKALTRENPLKVIAIQYGKLDK